MKVKMRSTAEKVVVVNGTSGWQRNIAKGIRSHLAVEYQRGPG
jgi:hypothetical protein